MAKKPKTNYSGSDKDTFILSDATQQNILTLIKSYTSEGRSRLKDRRDRFQIVDKKLQLEFEREKRGSKHDYQYDHRPPIMLSHLDTAYAFFTDLFANGDPIFQIVGAPEQKDIITQMQLKVDQDVEEYRYQNNIAKAMRDALKYDECTLELDWESRLLPTFGPSDTDGRATVNKNMYEGNKLKYISPYNTFYDETVEHGRRHVDGTHAGYFEMVSLPVLHREITSMISVGKSVMNFNDVYTAGVTERNYMMPEIGGKQSQSSPDSNGMRSLFNFGDTTNSVDKKYEQYKEMYERTTVYVRFIPYMYGINCPDSTRVQIFKFVVVNNTLILAERITNIQQYFPMLTAQLNDENIGVSKSMAELLMPTQNLAEELADLKLASLYKANGDKLIYDARIISKADIESRKPDAKIPARPSALGRGLQEAVYPLRSDATAFNLISAIEGTLGQDAANITGQNNASRGQFQKGNKTLREYQDVMTNAEAVKYVKAILMESTFFMPLKSMIRNNILQYTTGGEVNVRGNTATIDPVALRKAALGFRVADGLKNVERLAKTGALQEAINMLLPQAEVALAQGVDVFAVLFQYLFLQGFNVENYRVAPQNLRAQANQQPPATPPDAASAG
ncbi:hypothetical protein P5_0021 [Aeromonas phage P5]|nr:hypothetical protein P5_0021 [Aeromonas phage P5]